MKLLLPLLVIAAVVMIAGSCLDQTPAELSLTCSRAGQQQPCRALVWNAKGAQVRDESSDFNGVIYMTGLVPGKYKITFSDVQGNLYAAQRWITLQPGDTQNIQVDLDVKDDPQYAETQPEK